GRGGVALPTAVRIAVRGSLDPTERLAQLRAIAAMQSRAASGDVEADRLSHHKSHGFGFELAVYSVAERSVSSVAEEIA
ncbi:MAG: hypothetical protein DMF85_18140, partial [Acidobacteria bacterium]